MNKRRLEAQRNELNGRVRLLREELHMLLEPSSEDVNDVWGGTFLGKLFQRKVVSEPSLSTLRHFRKHKEGGPCEDQTSDTLSSCEQHSDGYL